MRKNNDGYVLPFVLVVMIVLCIMSASLMTAAFRNLQIQQKFTDRMVDKYAAQGEIEKIVAQLKHGLVIEGNSEELTSESLTREQLAQSLTLADNTHILDVSIPAVTQVDQSVEEDEASEEDEQTNEKKSLDFTVSLDASSEATTIACELLVSAEYTSEQQADSKYTHTITVDKITYQSYEISTGGGT